jgi:acetyl esterase/lipase
MGTPGDDGASPGGAPIPAAQPDLAGWRRYAVRAVAETARATLRVSPRPMAMLIRREFAKGGARTREILDRHAPAGTVTIADERYGPGADELLDVHVSAATAGAGAACPTVVWVHGGGWVGGTKEEVAGYLRLLTDHGFTGVAIRYSLAPGSTYPTPLRQTMHALAHVTANAERLHVDPQRLFLGGDSAGAQIAAQVAAVVTSADYANVLGVAPTISPAQLRAVALCCGPYDPELVDGASQFATFLTAILWSYSGTRDWRNSPLFSTMNVATHLSPEFPPAFVTVGNADPLAEHSHRLVDALRAEGVDVEAMFYPPDHQPPLPHEYQFDLDLADARTAFARLVDFFTDRIS